MRKRIIYQKDNELVVVIPIAPIDDVISQLPTSKYKIEDTNKIPSDRTFRDAWSLNGSKLTIDVEKAKSIAHSIRRLQRDIELRPFDEIISKQIPGISTEVAEAERQKIRDKYSLLQENINKASTAEEILKIINPPPPIDWELFYNKLLNKPFTSILKKIRSKVNDWDSFEEKLSSNSITIEEATPVFKEISKFLTVKELKTFKKLALDNNINIL